MHSFWSESYSKISQELLGKMLMGSVGVLHLGQMAESILNQVGQTKNAAERDFLLSLGADMLLAAYEHDCLNASYAKQVQVVEKAYPHMPQGLKPVLDWLLANYI